MFSLLLVIIYIAFISLGLPDSLLGSAWPVMRLEFGAELSMQGIISMIISASTIVSSLMSNMLNRRLGTGKVVSVSVLLTAVSLFLFSRANSVIMMCIIAIPYGLGAGAIDAALNNYVAIHYSARHMSWLHCCWGVGAAVSPYIMSTCISWNLGWRQGYLTVSVIQIIITVFMFAALPMWKNNESNEQNTESTSNTIGILDVFKIKGVIYILIAFFCYCSFEWTAGLWTASYFKEYKGMSPEDAAGYASLFYLGLTGGRFLNGFIANKLGDKIIIRMGLIITAIGIILLLLPFDGIMLTLIGLLVIGIGCAPIYPSIIHTTPVYFGKEKSQAIVGVQMAFAYVGSTIMPYVCGFAAQKISIGIYPFFLLFFIIATIIMTELLNVSMSRQKA